MCPFMKETCIGVQCALWLPIEEMDRPSCLGDDCDGACVFVYTALK